MKIVKVIAKILFGILFLIFAIAAFGSVPQTDYDKLMQEKEQMEAQLQETSQELEKVTKEYENYKEQMKPFEEMTAAQAKEEKARAEQEAKRIAEEEEQKKKAAEEAEKKKAEEEAKKKAAEEAKGYETGITYDQLARTPDDYKGKKVKFKGEVVQVIQGDDEIQIRLALDDNYDKVLLCAYEPSIVKSRVLEDDTITIYGTSVGLISYESTLGGQITIPGVWIDKIDQ